MICPSVYLSKSIVKLKKEMIINVYKRLFQFEIGSVNNSANPAGLIASYVRFNIKWSNLTFKNTLRILLDNSAHDGWKCRQ